MSKADFEFYGVSEALPTFVKPRPNNDYYQGVYTPGANIVPTELYEVARDTFAGDMVEDPILIEGGLDPRLAFYEKQLRRAYPDDYLHLSALTMKISPQYGPIDETALFYKFQDITRAISGGEEASHTAKPLIDEKDIQDLVSEDMALEVTARVTPSLSAREDYPFLTNSHGAQLDPWLLFAHALRQRVYEWQPGPERNGGTLPPTYNPRPSWLLTACSVRVELRNPFITHDPV